MNEKMRNLFSTLILVGIIVNVFQRLEMIVNSVTHMSLLWDIVPKLPLLKKVNMTHCTYWIALKHQYCTLLHYCKAFCGPKAANFVGISWYVPLLPHSDLECLGTFGNWFWDLMVGNSSIVLNFYQQRPFFALKNYTRP